MLPPPIIPRVLGAFSNFWNSVLSYTFLDVVNPGIGNTLFLAPVLITTISPSSCLVSPLAEISTTLLETNLA